MEVSGYPHYENVASNVLGFFFQPDAEHGLGDLLLRAFIATAFGPDFEGANTAEVHRELATEAGGRLDLLIKAGGVVIGIENKIFHHANNDFADYAKLIDRHAGEERQRIKAVLTLKPLRDHEDMRKAGFVNVTYPALWQRVRDQIGHRMAAAHPKWLSYLFDFMDTTTRLSGEQNGFTATDLFLIEHHQVIERLMADRQQLAGRLARRVTQLQEMLDEGKQAMTHLARRWIYGSTCLVHDFEKDGYRVAMDLNVTLAGWRLTFFGRNAGSAGYVERLLQHSSISQRLAGRMMENGRHVIGHWPIETTLETLHQDMCLWVHAVSSAMAAN